MNLKDEGINVKFRWWFAWALLVLSVIGGVVDIYLYQSGRISQKAMVFHALVLSWLAITFTAYDIISTTDVRKQQDEPSED